MTLDNIKFFNIDDEIIEILDNVGPLEKLDGITVLQYMDRKTKGMDFGFVFLHNNIVYTIYKFDKELWTKPNDAGLVLTTSALEHTADQLALWKMLKHNGMNMSDTILKIFENALLGDQLIKEAFFEAFNK